MRSPQKLITELVLRQAHVRQHLGQQRYELWADGKLVKTCRSPAEVDAKLREWLDISDDESAALGRELDRLASS